MYVEKVYLVCQNCSSRIGVLPSIANNKAHDVICPRCKHSQKVGQLSRAA